MKRNILVIDSDLEYLQKAKEALNIAFNTTVATSKEQGLNELKRLDQLDLILVGSFNPRDEIVDLKEQLKTVNIPIIILDTFYEKDHKNPAKYVENCKRLFDFKNIVIDFLKDFARRQSLLDTSFESIKEGIIKIIQSLQK